MRSDILTKAAPCSVLTRRAHRPHAAGVTRERKLLRADCHAAKISYNLSDDWQALQLRLALAAGVKTAKETPDELLRALPNPAAIVGSKWLSKQDGRALPYKRMRDISFYDPSLQVVPVIALAELWTTEESGAHDRQLLLFRLVNILATMEENEMEVAIALPWPLLHRPGGDDRANSSRASSRPTSRVTTPAPPSRSETPGAKTPPPEPRPSRGRRVSHSRERSRTPPRTSGRSCG